MIHGRAKIMPTTNSTMISIWHASIIQMMTTRHVTHISEFTPTIWAQLGSLLKEMPGSGQSVMIFKMMNVKCSITAMLVNGVLVQVTSLILIWTTTAGTHTTLGALTILGARTIPGEMVNLPGKACTIPGMITTGAATTTGVICTTTVEGGRGGRGMGALKTAFTSLSLATLAYVS